MSRPAVPAALKRAVLEEAGYACAIPACRTNTTQIAHIEPWAKVRVHTFDNLIALCPNHHTRYDVEKKIPKKSILQYKANLAVLNGRYSTLERRLIEQGATYPDAEIPLHIGVMILARNLIDDGLIEEANDGLYLITGFESGIKQLRVFHWTSKGREYCQRWLDADPL